MIYKKKRIDENKTSKQQSRIVIDWYKMTIMGQPTNRKKRKEENKKEKRSDGEM